MLRILVFLVLLEASLQAACPELSYELGNKCIQFVSKPVSTFAEAFTECRNIKAEVMYLESRAEVEELEEVINTHRTTDGAEAYYINSIESNGMQVQMRHSNTDNLKSFLNPPDVINMVDGSDDEDTGIGNPLHRSVVILKSRRNSTKPLRGLGGCGDDILLLVGAICTTDSTTVPAKVQGTR